MDDAYWQALLRDVENEVGPGNGPTTDARQASDLLAERAAKGGGKKPARAGAKKAAPVAANDAGETPARPAKAKKKAVPKKKAKAQQTPRRTGTDG